MVVSEPLDSPAITDGGLGAVVWGKLSEQNHARLMLHSFIVSKKKKKEKKEKKNA